MMRFAAFVFVICVFVSFSVFMGRADAALSHGAADSLAKKLFYEFERRHVDRRGLDVFVDRELTDDLIRRESANLRKFGPPTAFVFLGSAPIAYATGYNVLIKFAHARVIESVAVDPDGKIGGIDFRMFVERKRVSSGKFRIGAREQSASVPSR